MPTNRDLCVAALRKIGVAAQGEGLDGADLTSAMGQLRRMLAAWQNRGDMLWAATRMDLTTALGVTSYDLTPRPLEVHSVHLRRGTVNQPLTKFTRNEFERLPLTALPGAYPTAWWADRQRDVTILHLWPTPITGLPVAATVTREILAEDPDDEADVPGEWEEAVVYGLAARLSDDYAIAASNVIARAEDELDTALAFDRQDSVYFVDEDYARH